MLDVTNVEAIPIPIDCTDGFGAAFWGRPEAYLDPHIQQGMSWLAQLPPDVLARGTARLGRRPPIRRMGPPTLTLRHL